MSRPFGLALFVAIFAGPLFADEPDGAEFFEKRIRPILVENCYGCHSGQIKEPKSKLRLDSRAAMLQGGERGPAIAPGDPAKSRLIQAISYRDVELQMPKRARLSDAAIADLTAWVKKGAPWPNSATIAVAAAKPVFDLYKRKAAHWAWQPIRVTSVPPVKDSTWARTDSDRFILAKLDAAGLSPALDADRRTWLRRVTFDLIGLPPTSGEIDAFLADRSSSAHAKVVDRLLASPHFGERWARHWLDLVRYAESRGHEFDPPIPNAYQYRDYVIRALNADVPYNQFVTEHIAGDLMPKPRLNPKEGFNESILGTGFWFFNEETHSPVDILGDREDRLDNRLDVFSKTFLGLTVTCARCHDHKFDAISQKDYYALKGFLLSSCYRQVRFDTMEQDRHIDQKLRELRDKYRPAILRAFAETFEPGLGRFEANLFAARKAIRAHQPGGSEEVRAWVKYLIEAIKDPDNPLYPWAVLCQTEDSELAGRLAQLDKEWRAREAGNDKHKDENSGTVISFTLLHGGFNCAGNDTTLLLKTDDFALQSPTLPVAGQDCLRFEKLVGADPVVWGSDWKHPIDRFLDRRAITRDAFWSRQSVAPSTESEYGVLGAVPRYGRIIRTRLVELENGKVFVLARGKGRIYAAVDMHTLIGGPLHGRLVHDFDTKGKWQWVLQDLTPYKGHLVHLEISPIGDGPFEVSSVFDGDSPPRQWRLPDYRLHDEKGVPLKPGDVPSAIKGYIGGVLESVAKRELHDPEDLDGLPNIFLQHSELFGVKDFSNVVEAAKPLFEGQAKLAEEVKWESRLAPAMWDLNEVDDQLHIRGSHLALGEYVPRRFLEALAGPAAIYAEDGGSGRLELAKQITDPSLDPYITRVFVNRVWYHLFGRGIVPTVDNFGVMGEKPTHPELLDFLADRFVKQGWSLKTLIRELVLSRAYGMSSRHDPAADRVDATNQLLHCARLRRLEGEAIRDAMLSVSGSLNDTIFGKSVPIHLTEFLEGRGRPETDGPLDGNGRRSLYLAVKRNFLSPFMLAFDTPTPFSTMGRRTVSNVPAQALILMNDPFVHQQADRWAKRVLAERGDTATRIDRMYVAAFARTPTHAELNETKAFLDRRGVNDPKSWSDLAHVLFNVKEFIYLP
jgi:hypothetical protein